MEVLGSDTHCLMKTSGWWYNLIPWRIEGRRDGSVECLLIFQRTWVWLQNGYFGEFITACNSSVKELVDVFWLQRTLILTRHTHKNTTAHSHTHIHSPLSLLRSPPPHTHTHFKESALQIWCNATPAPVSATSGTLFALILSLWPQVHTPPGCIPLISWVYCMTEHSLNAYLVYATWEGPGQREKARQTPLFPSYQEEQKVFLLGSFPWSALICLIDCSMALTSTTGPLGTLLI